MPAVQSAVRRDSILQWPLADGSRRGRSVDAADTRRGLAVVGVVSEANGFWQLRFPAQQQSGFSSGTM